MSIQDLGAIGELIGALLLFVSLIYVGFQIRQNTKSQQAHIRQEFSDLVIDWNRYLIDRPELRELVDRSAETGFEGMSEPESSQLGLHFQAALWGFSALYRHYQDGIVDSETWAEVDHLISQYCKNKAVRELWELSRGRLGKEFQNYFDGKLSADE